MSGTPALSPEQGLRYARQLLLPEVGRAGQERLLSARVLIRAGGGSTAARAAATYLAAAGVGTLCLAEEPAPGTFGWDEGDLRALNPDAKVVAALPGDADASFDAVIDLTRDLTRDPTRRLAADADADAGAPGPDGPAAALAGALAAVEALKRLLGVGSPAPAA